MRLEMSPCVTHAKNKAKYYPRHSWREKKKKKLKQKSCILRMISESVDKDNLLPILNYLPFEKLCK